MVNNTVREVVHRVMACGKQRVEIRADERFSIEGHLYSVDALELLDLADAINAAVRVAGLARCVKCGCDARITNATDPAMAGVYCHKCDHFAPQTPERHRAWVEEETARLSVPH